MKGKEKMKQERFMVIDNQKGVIIPLQEEKTITLNSPQELKETVSSDVAIEEKIDKIHSLLKILIKQSVRETIKEYHIHMTKELKEYEQQEWKRWERLEKAEEERLSRIEEIQLEWWKKLEDTEESRWKRMEQRQEMRLEKIEEEMEKHFKSLDKNIREKQEAGKRKKHSIF